MRIGGAMSRPSIEPSRALVLRALCPSLLPASLHLSAVVASITACPFLPQGLCTASSLCPEHSSLSAFILPLCHLRGASLTTGAKVGDPYSTSGALPW